MINLIRYSSYAFLSLPDGRQGGKGQNLTALPPWRDSILSNLEFESIFII